MSVAVTRGIRVIAEATYQPERSSAKDRHYFFSYQITIRNESSEAVQLLSRHWKIHDADGNQEEVTGPGVVGEQPVLLLDDVFSELDPLRAKALAGAIPEQAQTLITSARPEDVPVAGAVWRVGDGVHR